MANTFTVGSRPGPPRASHLPQITTGNAATFRDAVAEEEKVESHERLQDLTKGQETPLQHMCTLRVHDRDLSIEDVLLNFALFPHDAIRVGRLMQITAHVPGGKLQHESNTSQRKNQNQGPNPEHAKRRPRPMSPVIPPLDTRSTREGILHLNSAKRHVFIAEEIDPKILIEQPNLEVSISLP